MKKLMLIVLILVSSQIYAQDSILSEQDGVVISCKLSKLQDGDKKDTYLLSVKALNKNTFDVFYQGPKNGINPFFSEITIRSVDQYIYLTAIESKLSTAAGKLFYLRAGGSISGEKEFKIGKGITPIITSKYFSELRPISEYR